jgi:hypothetical protein
VPPVYLVSADKRNRIFRNITSHPLGKVARVICEIFVIPERDENAFSASLCAYKSGLCLELIAPVRGGYYRGVSASLKKNVASRDGKVVDLICCQSDAYIIVIDEDEFMACLKIFDANFLLMCPNLNCD